MTCPDGSSTARNVHLLDVGSRTGTGRPLAMLPTAISLSGTGGLGSIITLSYSWLLIADV